MKNVLTIPELNRLNESIQYNVSHNRFFDPNQDFSVRYNYNGFEYFTTAKSNDFTNLKKLPMDAHICNVIGNMNYTAAYKAEQAYKDRKI